MTSSAPHVHGIFDARSAALEGRVPSSCLPWNTYIPYNGWPDPHVACISLMVFDVFGQRFTSNFQLVKLPHCGCSMLPFLVPDYPHVWFCFVPPMFVPFLPSMMLGDSDSTKVAQLDTAGLFAGAVDTCFDKAKGPRVGAGIVWQFRFSAGRFFNLANEQTTFWGMAFHSGILYIYNWVYHHNFWGFFRPRQICIFSNWSTVRSVLLQALWADWWQWWLFLLRVKWNSIASSQVSYDCFRLGLCLERGLSLVGGLNMFKLYFLFNSMWICLKTSYPFLPWLFSRHLFLAAWYHQSVWPLPSHRRTGIWKNVQSD